MVASGNFMKTALFIFQLVTFLSCSVASAQSPEGPAKQFNVGIVVPLTGDLAEYGSAIRNGFELAKLQSPDKFNSIRFVYEDSRYDGKTAVEALQKLRSTNKINLYYLWGVSPTEAMLPIAASQKLAVIAETTVKEATVAKPLVIRAARTGERIAKALSAELAKRNVKSVSFIVTEIPFYTDILKHLTLYLKAEGIEIRKSQAVLPSQSDFKSFLLDRNSLAGEIMGVLLLPSQLITFYNQADQYRLPLKTFNADILDSQSIVEACPDNINGTFFTQVGVTPQFRETYTKKFGDDIQIGSAAQSFDVANLISDLFGSETNFGGAEEIIERLSRISNRTGATGQFGYSETPDGGKEIRMPVSMKTVENKKITTISEDTGF